jgi:hypothetical protein
MRIQLTTSWATVAISLLILILALTGCHHDRVEDPAAAFTLPNVRGGEFRYPTLEHHNLLMAFLQTQPDIGSEHNPSRSVVPFLMSMDHQYREAGVEVVVVDATALATYPPVAGKVPPMDTLLNVSYEWALTVPMVADPKGKVAKMYGVMQVPTIILIDSDGRIAERWERMPHPGVLAWGIQQLVGGPMAGRPIPKENEGPRPAQN